MVNEAILQSFNTIALLEGRGFFSSIDFTDIDKRGDTDRNILIRNPSGSGIVSLLASPTIIPSGPTTVEPIKNVTVTDPGTAEITTNTRTGGSDNSETLVTSEATYSGGTSYGSSRLPSGGTTEIATTSEQQAIVIEDGDNMLFLIENRGAFHEDVTVQLAISETLSKNIPTAWTP